MGNWVKTQDGWVKYVTHQLNHFVINISFCVYFQISSSLFSLQIQRDHPVPDNQLQGFQTHFSRHHFQCHPQYPEVLWNSDPVWELRRNSGWQSNCYYWDFWLWCDSSKNGSRLCQVRLQIFLSFASHDKGLSINNISSGREGGGNPKANLD